MTIDCLVSIEGEIDDGVLVIVVGNNSGDGSYEKIEDSITRVVHFFGGSSGVTKILNLKARNPSYYYEARTPYIMKY